MVTRGSTPASAWTIPTPPRMRHVSVSPARERSQWPTHHRHAVAIATPTRWTSATRVTIHSALLIRRSDMIRPDTGGFVPHRSRHAPRDVSFQHAERADYFTRLPAPARPSLYR